MKNNSTIFTEESHYEAPVAELLTIDIEAGFALSNEGVGEGGMQHPF